MRSLLAVAVAVVCALVSASALGAAPVVGPEILLDPTVLLPTYAYSTAMAWDGTNYFVINDPGLLFGTRVHEWDAARRGRYRRHLGGQIPRGRSRGRIFPRGHAGPVRGRPRRLGRGGGRYDPDLARCRIGVLVAFGHLRRDGFPRVGVQRAPDEAVPRSLRTRVAAYDRFHEANLVVQQGLVSEPPPAMASRRANARSPVFADAIARHAAACSR